MISYANLSKSKYVKNLVKSWINCNRLIPARLNSKNIFFNWFVIFSVDAVPIHTVHYFVLQQYPFLHLKTYLMSYLKPEDAA